MPKYLKKSVAQVINMIKYIPGKDDGQITKMLMFRDSGISKETCDEIESFINTYPENSVMEYEPENKEATILIYVICNDDKCRKIEADRFIEFYNHILSEINK